jgi:hypothetical protein
MIENSIKDYLRMSVKSFYNTFLYLFLAIKKTCQIVVNWICGIIAKYPKAVLIFIVLLSVVYFICYIGKVRATGYAVSKYRYQVTLYQDSLRDIEAMRY